MTEPSRPEIDVEAIARDMTDTGGPAALHARVMARLDAAPVRRWTASGPIVRAAAVSAVLVVALVALTLRGPVGNVVRDPGAVPPPPPRPSVLATPAPMAPPAAPVTHLATHSSTPRRAVPPLPPTLAAVDAGAVWRARSVPALSTPDAVDIDAIQPEAVAIPLLELTPLTPMRVALLPLGESQPGGVR